LRRDVRFALTFKVGKRRRPLTDTERDMVADAIVEHIKLCNWKVERGAPCVSGIRTNAGRLIGLDDVVIEGDAVRELLPTNVPLMPSGARDARSWSG
jgi:hypothetical protein